MSISDTTHGFNIALSSNDSNPCADKLGTLIFQLFTNFIIFMGMVIVCNVVHYALKPFSQPRITSDILVGLIVGNIDLLREEYEGLNRTFGFIIDVGMMCYMFALGIEMDPYVLFKRPTREAQVAYTSVLITFIIACSTTPFLHYFSGQHKLEFTLSLSTLLSSTASPVLTRVISQLKIDKSDIGRLVTEVGMLSDFICFLILSIGYIAMPLPTYCNGTESHKWLKTTISMGSALLAQTVFTAIISPIFMNWVNNENPEGRPMKGSHLVLSVAFMVLICVPSSSYGYSPILSAFMAGICLPREGRVSKWVISKINYLLTTIFFPFFFMWMGYAAHISDFESGQLMTWARLLLLVGIAKVGKVAGTIVSGSMLGIHLPETVAIGLLLTTKGHFHIYLAIRVMNCGATLTTGIVMVIAIFFTVWHAPIVVASIIERARKRAPTHRMALQLLDPSSELRILLCVHGTQSVPAALNFMEISRGSPDPGIQVYATDLIELTDYIAASLERVEGMDTVTVKDKGVVDMRAQITSCFQEYVDADGDGITLRRAMTLADFNNMGADICTLAEDLMIALIILPFHKIQREDGKLDAGNAGFRYVYKKVLRHAPCSVGILVDRGLGKLGKITRTQVCLNVAVIFIGGKDDREALALAGRIAQHPGVKLTVLRFLVDSSDPAPRGFRVNLSEKDEEEMGLDDECFAQFYEKHILGGRISYIEKHLANSAETFSTLQSFEGQYTLIIVGRGGGVNSVLTMGMNDWQRCPELGPIGDVLSGPEFLATVSVLIIQQHRLRGELAGLDDDFTVM
ncbi:hypothetical protein L6164_017957 [Bauhinia variegata]|uniref:Uncharacterized protein n=1 Tax=Bauhinia variegata TaxID=167791 RepID=A0ACB9NEH8_BAUVA|nr:hypothetical protein L6164_017957 [Bauhinia variegata]